MAQHFTDFAGNTPGSSPPTGWSERWTASGSYEVAAGPVAAWQPNFTSNFDFLSWDTVGSISGDCEVLVRVRTSAASGVQAGAVIHGATGATSGYFVSLAGGGTTLLISRMDTGTETSLSEPSFTWAADTDYWIRFQRSSSAIRARVWADGGGEPGTWLYDGTDSTYTSGSAGLFVRNGFSGTKQWNAVGVGTGGDSAPSTTPATGHPHGRLSLLGIG